MNAPAAREAVVSHPRETEVIGPEHARIRLLVDADAAGGSMSTVEVTLTKGADGALPHYHTRSDELFYIAEGELQVLAGDRIVTVAEGGSVLVPRLMPHAFGAAPDSTARILISLAPGVRRFDYFRLLDRVAAGTATLADLGPAQDEFDNHFVDAPAWWAERDAHRS